MSELEEDGRKERERWEDKEKRPPERERTMGTEERKGLLRRRSKSKGEEDKREKEMRP